MSSQAPTTSTPPTKPRGFHFPIGARIFAWFIANLALLLVGAWILIRFQFATGIDSFLANHVGDRMQPLARLIHDEIRSQPPSEWDAILDRFSTNSGLQFFLFLNENQQLAGVKTTLPPEVTARFKDGREDRPDTRPGGPGQPGARPRFFVHSQSPSGYWFGQRMAPFGRDRSRDRDRDRPRERERERDREGDRPPPSGGGEGKGFAGPPPSPASGGSLLLPTTPGPGLPATRPFLLIYSESISAGGLFLDDRPMMIAATAALIVSLLFWFPLVHGITQSIRDAKSATQEISEGHFNVRLDESRRDELGDLGRGINQMAVRLDGLVSGQKRFLGDVAHELCAPLARAQMALGILETQVAASQRESIADLQSELDEMSHLVHELLSFSKASLSQKSLALEPVELRELAQSVIQKERNTDGPCEIRMSIPDDLRILGHRELLSRALGNLLRNAQRYAGKDGPITLEAVRHPTHVTLIVKDEGPGVPQEAMDRIFDPFFRVDPSRTRDTGGTGLGLAIVKTCVEACQGSVRAQANQPTGLQVIMEFPIIT